MKAMRSVVLMLALLIALLAAGAPAATVLMLDAGMAQAAGPAEVRDLMPPGVTTVDDGVTTYTSITTTVNGALIARVVDYETADIIVSAGVPEGSTNKLAVTVRFSNDLTNWADAKRFADDGDTITYSADVTPTSALLHVPIMGEFMRLKLTATGNVTSTVVKALLK